jgi:hypothetical protein
MFCVQRADNSDKFDEVDEFIFKNRKFAILEDGSPRYTANWATQDKGGNCTLNLVGVNVNQLAVVMRLCGGKITDRTEPVNVPDMIKFHRGNSTYYYQASTGKLLVEQRRKTAA